MAAQTTTRARPKLTLVIPLTRLLSFSPPKLSIIIPFSPSLSFSNPTTPSSTSRATKTTSATSLPSSTTPRAPTTLFPPDGIYPSIPKLNPCLQCHLLGLRCSFTTAAHVFPRVRLHRSHARPDKHCCVRCKKSKEQFCILQVDVKVDEETKRRDYCADGVEEGAMKKKVKDLYEERKWKVRFALLAASEEHIEGINPGRWRWKREESEDEKESSGTGESVRADAGPIRLEMAGRKGMSSS